MINNKAELTSKQIVTIIILLLSFIVVLILIFRLGPEDITEKEICHNSVALKGQSGILSSALDCKVSYTCISGGDDCENFQNSYIKKINLKKGEEAKKQVMNAIAEEMADCWWMFGEGKVEYADGNILSGKVACALCSIIKFDAKINAEVPTITYQEFYEYLKNTKKSETQTYLTYLYEKNDLISQNGEHQISHINLASESPINTNSRYSIITGINYNRKIPLIGIGWDDNYFGPFIIDTSKTSQTECDEYLTKFD